MPEEQSTNDLSEILESIEDYDLNIGNYNAIIKAVESGVSSIKSSDLDKLISIFCYEFIKKKTFTTQTLTILSLVLKNVKKEHCILSPNIVTLLLAILETINNAELESILAFKVLCFEILQLFPDEILTSAVLECPNKFYLMVKLYCNESSLEVIFQQMIGFLLKILQILPASEKSRFVEGGIDTWLSALIPSIFDMSQTKSGSVENAFLCLDVLTNELVPFNYLHNSHWLTFFENLSVKYPLTMVSLLKSGCNLWHIMWKISVKLIKNQVRNRLPSVGSPINALLSVQEMAFKMDVDTRCHAFECWNVLIDALSYEKTQDYIKRLKLLLVPLVLNNAKVEKCALVKFNTWWHLIEKFKEDSEIVLDFILLPFLSYCFGTPGVTNKSIIISGLLSEATKKLSIQSFVNILGHYNCMGCLKQEEIGTKLIKPSHLVINWTYWLHYLSIAIKICVEIQEEEIMKQLKCAWKSFLATLGELPEDKKRNYFFIEVLNSLQNLLQECNYESSEAAINILIPALFEGDKYIEPLVIYKNDGLPKILPILIDPCNNNFYSRCNIYDTIKNLRSYTDYLVLSLKDDERQMLSNLPSNECGLILWTAFVESIMKQKYICCPKLMSEILTWPLSLEICSNVEKYTTTWFTFYDFLMDKTVRNESIEITLRMLNDKLFSFLSENKDVTTVFSLSTIISLIKYIFDEKGIKPLKQELQLLKILKKQIKEEIILSTVSLQLLDCMVLILNSYKTNIDLTCSKHLLMIINNVLKLTPKMVRKDIEKKNELLIAYKILFESIDNFFKIAEYGKFNSILLDGMVESTLHLSKVPNFENQHLISILNTFGDKDSKVNAIIKDLTKTSTPNKVDDQLNTTTTVNKRSTTPRNKKGANIVNTVVENGEEFVVVKSNWKFNPKKLTEKQKEKLQRKREDIPALYQDLSQSQDEINLNSWQTESTDTTLSTKTSSTSNETALPNNMPTSGFVPQLIECVNKVKTYPPSSPKTPNVVVETNSNSANNVNTTISDNKEITSPRMALNERVFCNVRNLMESSNESKVIPLLNPTVVCKKIPKTCLKTSNSVERPSRKRVIPKKYVDSTVFINKQRRHSIAQCDYETDNHQPIENTTDEKSFIDNKKSKCDEIHKLDCLQRKTQDSSNTAKGIEVNNDSLTKKIDQVEIKDVKNDGNALSPENLKNIDPLLKTSVSESEQTTPVEKSANKKHNSRKSRIEKALQIDMGEGNPFLNNRVEKRITRNALHNSCSTKRNTGKNISNKKLKVKYVKNQKYDSVKLNENNNPSRQLQPNTLDSATSQDIIESSQDSSVPALSVISVAKDNRKRIPIVTIEKISSRYYDKTSNNTGIQLNTNSVCNLEEEDKDDSELPQNKTFEDQSNADVLTEDMDTEFFDTHADLVNVCEYSQNLPTLRPINNDEDTQSNSQDTANANTQPMAFKFNIDVIKEEVIENLNCSNIKYNTSEKGPPTNETMNTNIVQTGTYTTGTLVLTANDAIKTLLDSIDSLTTSEASSPLKDDEQRKRDFLNSTFEISPIKTMSPVRNDKTPSPETSSDYLTIQLTTPILLNGEPIDKCNSLEIFTEDKFSPDKRDTSPPRQEAVTVNTSPSSSLSLRKNKPQVWSGGRGAQMLGLCVPDKLQTIRSSDKNMESDDIKKTTTLNTLARRDFRIPDNIDNNDSSDEAEDCEPFLKLRRNLPSTDCSPAGPILKRKHADLAGEATPSPASKRKRVSFHDPPVSTTMCVQKYIEQNGVRSPQSSTIKRQERSQLRSLKQTPKFQRRLDKALSETQSFIERYSSENSTEDTQMSSLDQTPVVEIAKISELNNVDPICSELVDCKDPIDNIATDLSSPAMKALLVKELEGKIETIGDLANLTELEVNRLRIKAPKVETAKKALHDFLISKKTCQIDNKKPIVIDTVIGLTSKEHDKETTNAEIQTDIVNTSGSFTQTDGVVCSHNGMQTKVTGNIIQEHEIAAYISEKPKILNKINDAEFKAFRDTCINRLALSDSHYTLNRIIQLSASGENNRDKMISFFSNYLRENIDSKDFLSFWCDVLKNVCDKP